MDLTLFGGNSIDKRGTHSSIYDSNSVCCQYRSIDRSTKHVASSFVNGISLRMLCHTIDAWCVRVCINIMQTGKL